MARFPSALALEVLAAIATLLLANPVSAQRPQLPEAFQVGKPFPTLSFPTLDDGRPSSVADFRGKRLILHVFASW